MSKRLPIIILAAAVAGTMLASGVAIASAPKKPNVVPIVMHDPGCHFFQVNGKLSTRLTVTRPTVLRNLDEAALIVKSAKLNTRIAVGKSLAISKPGVYRITMVGQARDDNHLVFVRK
ncbi:MAG: hypothetical protein ACM3QU_12310 [Verrucomicrobiota bacterium]